MQRADTLGAWEPTYPAYEAKVYESLALSTSTASGDETVLADLQQSRNLYAEAVAREPLDAPNLLGEAEIYGYLSEVQTADAKGDLDAAASLARQAIRDSPRDPTYRELLQQVMTAERPKAAKRA
jgi:hypothetical protein